MQPSTQYAKSGDVHIAYQVFGDGPLNIIFAPPAFCNVEHWWDHPDATRWLLRMASYARVVMFDKRGTGMSDPVADLPGLCRLPNYAEWFWEEPVICAYLRVVERSSSQFHSA